MPRMPPTARKAHNKSRAGCTRCKSKKIKCDEKQPCSYCLKRCLPCSLQPEPKRAPTALAVVRQPSAPSFTFADFGLFRHFTESTAVANSADYGPSCTLWSEAVPDMATRYPYLMHELLAVAAVHRMHTHPDESAELRKTAAEHQSRAIPLFRQALAAVDAGEGSGAGEDVLPLFACSCLIIPYHFAAATDAAALLGNEDTGSPPEWLVLIEGCAAITQRSGPAIMNSPLRPLLGDPSTPPLSDLDNCPPSSPSSPSSPADQHLVDLKRSLPAAPEHRAAYAATLDRLRQCYRLSERAGGPLARNNAALRFAPAMGQPCKEHLAQRRPAALVVVAFWCVLLYRAEERWWLEGRARLLLARVAELLPREHRCLIAWPLEQLGVPMPGGELPR